MKNVQSLYIHIPYCISKCKYCDFFSVTKLADGFIPQSYIDALCNEIEFRLKDSSVKSLKTIYIGGGTPSLLTANQLNKIISTITHICFLQPDYEFTLEVNPDDVTEDFLKNLKNSKVNRISLGIQSLNNDCLAYAGRRASLLQNLEALELIKNSYFDFSIDLICGLPEETEKSFLNGLQSIISYKPSHISMYSLTIEDETPFGKLFLHNKLNVNSDFSDDLWLKGRDILKKSEYIQYEVSNFALPDKECKHNLVYWNHQSYIGCGAGGTGTLYELNGCGERWTNTVNLQDYINYWISSSNKTSIAENREKIDLETSKFEFFMMALRKLSGITEKEYFEIFGEKLPENFLQLAASWNQKKLMDITVDKESVRYALNSRGILFLNNFLENL